MAMLGRERIRSCMGRESDEKGRKHGQTHIDTCCARTRAPHIRLLCDGPCTRHSVASPVTSISRGGRQDGGRGEDARGGGAGAVGVGGGVGRPECFAPTRQLCPHL